MRLADAEHGVLAAFGRGLADAAGFVQVDEIIEATAPTTRPADHAGDGFLVHAVLQRDDEAALGEVRRMSAVAHKVS